MKVCILRRSAVAERLSTKAVSDGFFTIGFLPALRRLFKSLIFLILSRSAIQPWALRRIVEMGFKKALIYSVMYHKNLLSRQLLLSIPPFKKYLVSHDLRRSFPERRSIAGRFKGELFFDSNFLCGRRASVFVFGWCMFNKLFQLAGLMLYENLNDWGTWL